MSTGTAPQPNPCSSKFCLDTSAHPPEEFEPPSATELDLLAALQPCARLLDARVRKCAVQLCCHLQGRSWCTGATAGIAESEIAKLKQLPLVISPGTGGEECLRRCGLDFNTVNRFE